MLITVITFQPKTCISHLLKFVNTFSKVINICFV